MDVEEIEAIYQKECDKAKEAYLVGLKSGKKRVDLENEYKIVLNKVRAKYYKDIMAAVSKDKGGKKRDFKGGEKTKAYKVKPAQLSLTTVDSLKNKFDLFSFRMVIVLKKIFRPILKPFRWIFYPLKIGFNSRYFDFRVYLSIQWHSFLKYMKLMGVFLVKVWNKLKVLFMWIAGKVFKKKKKDKDKEEGDEDSEEE